MTLPKTRRCETVRATFSGRLCACSNLSRIAARISHTLRLLLLAANRFGPACWCPSTLSARQAWKAWRVTKPLGPMLCCRAVQCAVCSVIVQGRNRDIEPRRFAAAMTVDSAILPPDARNLIS